MPSRDLRDAADDALRATSENEWPNSTNVNDKALDPATFEPCLCDLVAPYLASALASFTILKPYDSAAEFRSVSVGFQDMNPGYRERANLMFAPCVQCPLRRKALFRPFSDAELDFVARMKTDHIVIAPRADIIREDEVGGSVYTLFEGWAVRHGAGVKYLILCFLAT
jgi:hypothetical protein